MTMMSDLFFPLTCSSLGRRSATTYCTGMRMVIPALALVVLSTTYLLGLLLTPRLSEWYLARTVDCFPRTKLSV